VLSGAAVREGPLVHLFDGHVYVFRAYYSLPPMHAPDGTPCNAAYGFANTLVAAMAWPELSHAAVCFDHSMRSFRNDIEPGYKAQRGEPPEDLEPQFALCREVAEALGFAVFERESFEADDLLATLSSHVVRRRGRAIVYSTDKDLCQLVREDGRVVLHDLARDRTSDADGVRERFGVDPAQIPDFLGLVGDAVDNLPGVPGVGARTAAALLRAFGSIESIPLAAEAWADVPVRGARRLAQRLGEHRDRALLTKRLASVRHDVPDLTPGLGELRHRGASPGAVSELFDRLGWDRIRSRIPRWRGGG